MNQQQFKSVNPIYTRESQPASEPLSVNEVKNHLRIDLDCMDDHTYLEALIIVAREVCENVTNQIIGEQNWSMTMDALCYDLEISKVPVISITSFKYKDANNAEQNITDVFYDLKSKPARVQLNDIPTLYEDGYAKAEIKFKAGMLEVPAAIKSAMLLIIGHLYENRQDVITGTIATEIPMTSQYLLAPYIHHEFR